MRSLWQVYLFVLYQGRAPSLTEDELSILGQLQRWLELGASLSVAVVDLTMSESTWCAVVEHAKNGAALPSKRCSNAPDNFGSDGAADSFYRPGQPLNGMIDPDLTTGMEVSDNPGAVVNSQSAAAQPRVSIFEQINLNVFWLANNFHWQALLAIVIPSMVVKFLGNANKDINLAMVVIWGTLVAFAVNPVVGAVSDYATFRMGRRRPFLIMGTIFNVIALVPK